MTYAIEGTTGTWEVVIGLEVHAQVISKAKLFSGAATDFGSCVKLRATSTRSPSATPRPALRRGAGPTT